jgi:hypothetical protein
MRKRRRGANTPLHLRCREWPLADQELWTRAVSNDDPFADARATHLSKHTLDDRCNAWRRFLGFLSREEPLALDIAPAERLNVERLRAFASHLAHTNAPRTIAAKIEKLYGAARIMMPECDWAWLKRAKARLYAAARFSMSTGHHQRASVEIGLGTNDRKQTRTRSEANGSCCG